MSLGDFFRFLTRLKKASNLERSEIKKRRDKPWEDLTMRSGDVHVVPVHDLEPHILRGTACKCGPFRDTEEPRMVIHSAFDGRELVERVEMGLPI